MKVAIVTVDYNNHADTIELIQSLTSLNLSNIDYKIVLVDNGSTAPLYDELPKISLNIDIVQTGTNKGFAGGYNHGIKYALSWGAEYILIINNDTLTPEPNLIKRLLYTFKKHPRAGVVAPKILFAPGFEYHKERYSNADSGHVIWYAGGYFDWDNVQGRHYGLDEVDNNQYGKVKKTDFVTGCCFMIKAEVFENIGFLDESLFAYFEDVQFTHRIKKRYQLYFNGKTYIYHKVSRTAGIGSPLTDYLTTRNRLYFGMEYSNNRTRFALFRESIRLLLTGREMQKQGIMDYLLNKKNLPKSLSKTSLDVKYQFDLSIIIVHYKTLDLTAELLKSIFDRKNGFNKAIHEVILIDNASDDGIENVINKYSQIKFIQNKKNLGFAKANNQGIDYSLGKYVLLLNSDTLAHENSFEYLVKNANNYNETSVIAGKLVLPDGSIQKSCFNLPTISGAIKEYFLLQKGSYEFYLPPSNKHTKIEGAVMACFLIPRKIINSIGKLAEDSFMYFEDIEYCRRVKQAGYNMYYVPECEFDHIHGASSRKLKDGEAYEYLKKGSIFYHGPFKYHLLSIILWFGQRYRKIFQSI